MDDAFWEFYRELTDDEGLIAFAANSMSEPLVEVSPGVCFIKTEAAARILKRARELSGEDMQGDDDLALDDSAEACYGGAVINVGNHA